MQDLITTTLESDGLLLATIDMPDRTMNVFSFDLMDALDRLMDRVDSDGAVRCVVITSGKATGFLAGADLTMVRGFCSEARTASHDRMFDTCGRLGRQFVRLEASTKPWVAAVNGLALGGGLELAMACRARITSDERRVQLGLPEIRWGLLPGAGGTQRLPRLVGFELGIDMLLTGRSLSAAEAVERGLFSAAVEPEHLLDEARALARSLAGTPWRPEEKYAHVAQSDVPAHSAETARAIAARFGADADDFERYPAYSAIIDSVLKGARLPLAEANTVEMNQFLRLMFNPVAGRMVRTLFLGRLRAERELRPDGAAKITAVRIGPISAQRQAWAALLGKLRLEKTEDPTLPADTIEMTDASGTALRASLRVLDEAPSLLQPGETAGVLAPAGPYGRVLEITGPDTPAAHALAALAAALWVLPWPSRGPASLLQALRGQDLAAQASQALVWAARPKAGDPVFLDVAACLAGVSPGWSGGPLSWLWDERERCEPLLNDSARAAWATLAPVLEQACA